MSARSKYQTRVSLSTAVEDPDELAEKISEALCVGAERGRTLGTWQSGSNERAIRVVGEVGPGGMRLELRAGIDGAVLPWHRSATREKLEILGAFLEGGLDEAVERELEAAALVADYPSDTRVSLLLESEWSIGVAWDHVKTLRVLSSQVAVLWGNAHIELGATGEWVELDGAMSLDRVSKLTGSTLHDSRVGIDEASRRRLDWQKKEMKKQEIKKELEHDE